MSKSQISNPKPKALRCATGFWALRAQRAEDDSSCKWHLAQANANSVVNGVSDCRHPWMAGVFPQPLRTVRPDTALVRHDDRFDGARIEIEHRRRLQIDEARREAGTRAGVEAHLLSLRQRQPLDRAAFDLVFNDGDVDGTSD